MIDVINVTDVFDIIDVTIRCVLVVVPRQTRGYIFPRQRGYDDSPAETEQLITVQFEVREPAPKMRFETQEKEALVSSLLNPGSQGISFLVSRVLVLIVARDVEEVRLNTLRLSLKCFSRSQDDWSDWTN